MKVDITGIIITDQFLKKSLSMSDPYWNFQNVWRKKSWQNQEDALMDDQTSDKGR